MQEKPKAEATLGIATEDSRWLQEKMGSALVHCLSQLTTTRPADPIGTLAALLRHAHHLKQDDARREAEREQLERLQQQRAKEQELEAKALHELHQKLEAEARERQEKEAVERRHQKQLEAARRLSEKQWKMDILHFTDANTRIVSFEGIRELLGKIDTDIKTKSDEELLTAMDKDKNGSISFEELADYLTEKYEIPVAPFDAQGHVPKLTRLTEDAEEEAAAAEGKDDAMKAAQGDGAKRDENGATELLKLVANGESVSQLLQATELPQLGMILSDKLVSEEHPEGQNAKQLAVAKEHTSIVAEIDQEVLRRVSSDVEHYPGTLRGFVWSSFAEELLPPIADIVQATGNVDDAATAAVTSIIEEAVKTRQAAFDSVSGGDLEALEKLMAEHGGYMRYARNAVGDGLAHVAISNNKPEVLKLIRNTEACAGALTVKNALGVSPKEVVDSMTDLADADREALAKILTEGGGTKVTFAEETAEGAPAPAADDAPEQAEEQEAEDAE